ncbi:MAG: zinc-binding dehydrogenase [Haliea sp.]|jgi:NADPH:quinone reductase-like Zn-dependent oxidoreductase|nr:zinc-binding dehydrogenase [Haliea sp.]
MKAAWFESFGSAADTLVLGEQPKPEPGPGEVLVKLATTGVNPSDVKKRAGAFPNLLDDGLVIPHSDGAGIVEAVGGGVDKNRIGERVFVYQAQYGRRFGTAAEYVALDQERAARLPDGVSFEVGACIGIPILTAHRCVFADGPVEGQTLLVTGGAGRVGYYAIQWASRAGATVIATASNHDDEASCRAMGADHVVNHRQENWGDAVLHCTGGEKVQRVVEVEFGANLPEVLKCIATGGTIATYSSTVVKEPQLPFLQMMFMDLTLRMVIVYAMPEEAKARAIADTCQALEQGGLQHRIAHSLPFEQIARSHELIEQGGFGGCVVVNIG